MHSDRVRCKNPALRTGRFCDLAIKFPYSYEDASFRLFRLTDSFQVNVQGLPAQRRQWQLFNGFNPPPSDADKPGSMRAGFAAVQPGQATKVTVQ